MAVAGIEQVGIVSHRKGSTIRFYDSAESHFVGFKAPSSATQDTEYSLPTAPPTANNYVLASTTAGALSWLDRTVVGSNLGTGKQVFSGVTSLSGGTQQIQLRTLTAGSGIVLTQNTNDIVITNTAAGSAGTEVSGSYDSTTSAEYEILTLTVDGTRAASVDLWIATWDPTGAVGGDYGVVSDRGIIRWNGNSHTVVSNSVIGGNVWASTGTTFFTDAKDSSGNITFKLTPPSGRTVHFKWIIRYFYLP